MKAEPVAVDLLGDPETVREHVLRDLDPSSKPRPGSMVVLGDGGQVQLVDRAPGVRRWWATNESGQMVAVHQPRKGGVVSISDGPEWVARTNRFAKVIADNRWALGYDELHHETCLGGQLGKTISTASVLGRFSDLPHGLMHEACRCVQDRVDPWKAGLDQAALELPSERIFDNEEQCFHYRYPNREDLVVAYNQRQPFVTEWDQKSKKFVPTEVDESGVRYVKSMPDGSQEMFDASGQLVDVVPSDERHPWTVVNRAA